MKFFFFFFFLLLQSKFSLVPSFIQENFQYQKMLVPQMVPLLVIKIVRYCFFYNVHPSFVLVYVEGLHLDYLIRSFGR
jgi:hypothetical protein